MRPQLRRKPGSPSSTVPTIACTQSTDEIAGLRLEASDSASSDRPLRLARLVDELGSPGWGQRQSAVRGLEEFGPEALEALCGALEDRDRRVQTAAAEALGEIADPRAVPALAEALRRRMVGRTARCHRFWAGANAQVGGVTVLFVAADTWCRMIQRPEFIPRWLLLTIGIFVLISWISERWAARRQDQRAAIAVSLAQIAARGGGREARSCLPDLEAVAQSHWGQSAAVRNKVRESLSVIRAVPEHEPHPIPSDAAPYGRDAQPVPAAAPDVRGELPLPSGDNLPAAQQLLWVADPSAELRND